jgi:proliferating cell nuclear antigen
MLLELDVKETSKATSYLDYLSEITKAGASTSEIVTVEFSSNMPIRLQFEIPQQGRLQYYMAPRLEEE